MMFNDEFIAQTKEWMLSNENHVSENEGAGDDINPNKCL